ncbi:MAG TPA: hypothetical protein DEV81_03110 [Cyanobacteria bacterium UBA11049]|nr:hypothetical protein [Cyanobacteria bacterium UBA11049]
MKDEFLAVLSHELRSPLNPILGWAKLLQTRKMDEDKIAQGLATIERNALLQSQLVEDLLDISGILRGKLSLNVGSVNLAATIRAAIETVHLAAKSKSIEIEAMLDPEVGFVSGDATRLEQVVWNLLSNAVKFTPAQGRVQVRLQQRGDCASITISDTGIGIHPNFLPHVFDYFRQANSAMNRQFGGLGLGLAIVRQLVEAHGGTVQAESPGEGLGATFIVRLPLLPVQATPRPNHQQLEQSPLLYGTQILVVDNEPDALELAAFVLEEAGARVIKATCAGEALAALMQSVPDVLVSDIGMPDIDGYMLIQQIRALPKEQGGQIPAIALSAYAGDINHQQSLSAGFQRHISKPIDPQEVVLAITELLQHNN